MDQDSAHQDSDNVEQHVRATRCAGQGMHQMVIGIESKACNVMIRLRAAAMLPCKSCHVADLGS